ESRDHTFGCFQSEREDARKVVACVLQFGMAQRLVTDAVDLVHDLPERSSGHLGLHRRRDGEGARLPTHGEVRRYPVGEPLALAQVEVQPRGEGTTEDGVHHHQREEIGRAARHADMTGSNLRLNGPGTIDDHDAPRAAARLDLSGTPLSHRTYPVA